MKPHAVRHLTWALIGLTALCEGIVTNSPIHLRLTRRNGRFARHESANLTKLAELLTFVEAKYAHTSREVDDNRLVRRWLQDDEDRHLFDTVGRNGSWFVTIPVGNPPQSLEFDLDMLSPDFYAAMSTSGLGSKYDTFASQSHTSSGEQIHRFCRRTSDVAQLRRSDPAVAIDFPCCTPPKSSTLTLFESGNIIGLGPAGQVARLEMPSFLEQLVGKNMVFENIWSITILDAETGVLTLGGTIVKEVERIKIQGEVELKHFGEPEATPDWVQSQVETKLRLAVPEGLPPDHHFKWTDTRGAAGWWTALMAGVWVNGAKVLKNQPVLFDVQSPFILAPPLAASRFYESIGGAKRLPPPHDNFFAFPCLNQVNIAFELGGWTFPSMNGEGTRADAVHGPAGGRFSLGKLGTGTGYCVGNVVETRMGFRKEWARAGVLDMWVLGEPFFRGLGVVFDPEKGRIGVRTY